MRFKSFLYQTLITLSIVLVAIWVYDSQISKRLVIVEQKAEAHQMNFDEHLYSGKAGGFIPGEYKNNFISVASESKEAVVYILAYEKVENRAFVKGYKREKGSGVVIHKDGYIVTNYHVIEKASHIEITLNNRKEYLAEVVGVDPTSDLALLKIEANELPFLVFGNSDNVNVGEWVLAVGNPFGLQSTVTAGIISAKARNIDLVDVNNNIESLIQSDVVINPGSSGGALINERGMLMGINTAIISASGNYEGISFAIPSNVARKVVFDLKQFGAVQRAKMGITLRDVDSHTADILGMNQVQGVLVEAVSFSGAAHDAGIKRGDVIIKINETSVNTTPEFNEKLNQYRPGDQVEISFIRDIKKRKAKILLRNHLNTTDFVAIHNNPILRALGIEIRNLNSVEKARTSANGIYVVSVANGSTAEKANIEPGYIVQNLNGRQIDTDQEFLKLVSQAKGSIRLQGFYERYPGEFPYILEMD